MLHGTYCRAFYLSVLIAFNECMIKSWNGRNICAHYQLSSNTANGCVGCMWRLAIKTSCSDLDSEIMISYISKARHHAIEGSACMLWLASWLYTAACCHEMHYNVQAIWWKDPCRWQCIAAWNKVGNSLEAVF